MSRAPLFLALVVVLATMGAGLVGADVTRTGSSDAVSPGLVPRAGTGSGLFGGTPAVPPGETLRAPVDTAGTEWGTDPVLDPAAEPATESPDDDAVRVGVIGSAFGGVTATLDGQVADRYRAGAARFGLTGGDHDTAVANVVAERTDEASLYLASVGYRPTPEAYDRAVRWLVSEDVDVIVDAGSYYPRTAEGMEEIAVAAQRAADEGVVFVTSGGNTAQRHWEGTAADEGWLSFADGVEGNRLGNGTVSGTVTLRLYWEDAADYDLYLYRDTPGADDPVVAKSTREEGHAEAIDATVPEGNYYVAVYVRDTGEGSVDLFAARHSLTHAGANGSAVAPATAEGVISVGAVESDGQLAAYSPADTDVRAPGRVELSDGTSLEGTSAAAPAVAGVVAAMEASVGDEGLSPAEVEHLLRATTRDGHIDAEAAVAAAAATANMEDDSVNATEGTANTTEGTANDSDERAARGP